MTQPKVKVTPKPRKPRKDPAEKLAEMMAAHEKQMAESIEQYETLIKNAQKEMAAMVKTVNIPATPPAPTAEAQWTEANGSRFLVLNEQAAQQIQSIFDVVGALAEQLKKL